MVGVWLFCYIIVITVGELVGQMGTMGQDAAGWKCPHEAVLVQEVVLCGLTCWWEVLWMHKW